MKLSTELATTSMISTIHVLKGKAALDDDTYRDFLARETGKRSAKELTVREAGRVIDQLRAAAGEPGPVGAVSGLDGAIGSKLRALWIAGFNLGIVRDRSDRAMLAYLQRQTGVSHIRFLQMAGSGAAAIEGLKSWLTRAGGVEWPINGDDVIAAKRAVLDAQWRKLIEIGAVKPVGLAVDPMLDLEAYATRVARCNRWETLRSEDYDQVAKSLGHKLRAALAKIPPTDIKDASEE
ncbi:MULTISPECIES: regulatory protein GemA [unclassified Bradyrhizobium]|uniref:regulatory protein GemA n=1 Tax=unclassified Bradyrhizobium TaxID=2631580 RepID=UPI0029162E65|nr:MULTISPECIES: regulatory protein GemA [unclassified Bradyrhizobium]